MGLERPHLVGTAAGAIVAIDYALSFPARVRSLVIANSHFGVQDESYLALGRRLRPSPQFEALPPEFRELGPAYRAADEAGTVRWIHLVHAGRPARPRAQSQSYLNQLTLDGLSTLSMPTFVLTGGADLYSPPAAVRICADRIPCVRFLSIPDVGHSAYWEQPDTFNRAVTEFLAKH